MRTPLQAFPTDSPNFQDQKLKQLLARTVVLSGSWPKRAFCSWPLFVQYWTREGLIKIGLCSTPWTLKKQLFIKLALKPNLHRFDREIVKWSANWCYHLWTITYVCHDGNTVLCGGDGGGVVCCGGRGAIKSPDTQGAHVIPNSHFGPRTDYQGFQGNLIGTYGKSCQKGAHNSYLLTTCLTAWNSVGRMVLLSKTRQTHVKTGPVPCLVRW